MHSDTDTGTADLDYDDLASQLRKIDRVTAQVEEEKTFSPNLHVRAKEGYGAPTEALSLLVRHFEDYELACSPTVTKQGDRAIMFRAAWGGF